jgi:hypothetical protein
VDVTLRDSNHKLLAGQKFKIYIKEIDADGKTVLDKTKVVGTFTLPVSGIFRFYLNNQELNGAPLEYLLSVPYGQTEIFAAFKVADSQPTKLEYIVGSSLQPVVKPTPKPAPVVSPTSLGLRGRIVLQVQSKGEAWYINPANNKRYSLGRPDDAWQVMKNLSIGSTNADLAKIRPNVDVISPTDIDSDADGLPDVLEQALSTNPNLADTDGDGFNDYTEVKNGFNPLGPGTATFDSQLTNRNLGKILLQVEGAGEAWYINPVNHQRYFLSRPQDALAVMRAVGLGITDADLAKISVGQ